MTGFLCVTLGVIAYTMDKYKKHSLERFLLVQREEEEHESPGNVLRS